MSLTKDQSVSTSAGVSCEVRVDLGDRSYPIYIGSDLLGPGEQLQRHVRSKKALIVSNTLIGPLYSSAVRKALESSGVQVFEVQLPDGEEYKSMEHIMTIMDKALDAKLDRKSYMIALGGGVVGDMTGFAAAIYQRGVRFVQVPTTVMAMVDSAVGGKTAVNHPKGKNMIGAFYQPEAVIIDVDTLKSLPDREFNSGLAEVVKYGLIRDAEFFKWLEENIDDVMRRHPPALMEIFRRSCENKAAVVNADEKESGVRATLNLGHTFGHAVEAGLGYGVWLHGEAVAVGIMMAADMSRSMGWISEDLLQRIRSLLERANLPTSLINPHALYDLGVDEYRRLVQDLTTSTFLDLMSMDKKVADGKLSLILLKGEVGNCIITDEFDSKILTATVDKYCNESMKK